MSVSEARTGLAKKWIFEMDPNGYGDPRTHGHPQYPQVRVEVPQHWAADANMRAVQHNDAYLQSQQFQGTALPARQYSVPTNQGTTPKAALSVAQVQTPPTSSLSSHHGTASDVKPQSVDYSLLLLGLAEEYFAAAYGTGVAGKGREPNPERFRKLISTGLSCLEAVLKVCAAVLYLRGCNV